MSENRCVCCGAVIPEGRQVCGKCEVGTDNNVGSKIPFSPSMCKNYDSDEGWCKAHMIWDSDMPEVKECEGMCVMFSPKEKMGNMNDLIASLKRAFKLYHEDMFAIGLVKDAMFDTGIKYCVKKKYEISVTALDDLINEIIVKEMRKNENGR